MRTIDSTRLSNKGRSLVTCSFCKVNAIKIYITTHLSDEQQYNGWPEMAFPGYKALKDNENF